MKKINQICLCILIGFSIIGVLGFLVLFFIDTPENTISIISTLVGIVGTIASIILSVIAMVYSNKSSKDAEMSLEKITNHYEKLYNALADEDIQKNLGKSGLKRIIQNNQPNQHTDNQKS